MIVPSHPGMGAVRVNLDINDSEFFTKFIAVRMYFLVSEYYSNHPEYGEDIQTTFT